jgi:hypothetical protein
VLAACETTDDLKLVSAKFSTTGALITITFNHDTDMAGKQLAGSFPCGDILTALLDGDKKEKLGSGATCMFISRREMFITMGVAPTLVVGGTITFKDGVISNWFNNAKGSHALDGGDVTTKINRPSEALVPTAYISGPSRAGSCAKFVLSGGGSTGGLGRQLTYRWTHRPPLEGEVLGGNSYIEINTALFPSQLKGEAIPHYYDLEVVNFMQQSSPLKSFKLTISSDSLPTIAMPASPMDTKANEALYIKAIPQTDPQPGCTPPDKFEWEWVSTGQSIIRGLDCDRFWW